jgi:hypothetical protein
MSAPTTLPPFEPALMSTAQLAAVSFLARYSGRTHHLYQFQLREWFAWCERNGLDPLVGVQRAHVELYIRSLGERGLMDWSVVSMLCSVRGFVKVAHIDGLIPADPAVYARLPKVQRDESRTHGLDRLELIRFLQVAQTISVHHGCPGVPARHQRAARLRSGGGADRGLHRVAAWAPRPAAGRQGQQARHHAGHRPSTPRARGLPRRTDQRPAGVAAADR